MFVKVYRLTFLYSSLKLLKKLFRDSKNLKFYKKLLKNALRFSSFFKFIETDTGNRKKKNEIKYTTNCNGKSDIPLIDVIIRNQQQKYI